MIVRRHFVQCLAATGIGTATLHRALAQQTDNGESIEITEAMIKNAEWVAGTELTDEQRQELAQAANQSAASLRTVRNLPIDFDTLPAVHFQPLVDTTTQTPPTRDIRPTESAAPKLPATDEELAFLPVTELAALMQTRQISSLQLTKLYLQRLNKYGPMLKCVVNLTEELAIQRARQADAEIAAGSYRGPLHGIPWGAKDLMAVRDYPTTWGIPQFKDRILDQTATVVQRLQDAGAVLVAKLSLGAIAMGDQWYGGMTRNPWNPNIGSSGSSAGSASAIAAGLVGFAIGTETLGSIVSPCRRCGTTGLRPTFGRVSRAGCMSLSWTMDKLGPIVRGVEDAALVFAAIHGTDGIDPTVVNKPFHWPGQTNLSNMKVGYVTSQRTPDDEREDLKKLQSLGVQLVEITLPQMAGLRSLPKIIDIEGAAMFEEMLKRNETEGWNTWPGSFRSAQFLSALDYLRFMRLRRQLMFEMEQLMQTVDVLANARDLVISNLTGHPSVVLPRKFEERNGWKSPVSDVFTGQLHGETKLLQLTLAYQHLCSGHLQHPDLDSNFEKMQAEDAKKQQAEASNDAAGDAKQ